MTGHRQRGLALASVLWGVLILSLIAAAMLSQSLTSAEIDHNVWNATQAGNVADEAAQRAILSLLDDRSDRQPRVDGTPATLAMDGARVRMWIQDESGKVNLNHADKPLLQAVFASGGMGDDAAGTLADDVLARRTASDSQPARPFHAVDELLDMPGVTRPVYDRLAPALTVFGQSTSVNQAVAPRAVLRALHGMDDKSIDDLLHQRDEVFARAASTPQITGPLGTGNTAFLITVEVNAHSARVVRSIAVEFTGDAQKPYLVLAWR